MSCFCVSCGVLFCVALKVAIEGVVRAKQWGCLAARTGLEIVVALATIVVAPFTKRRPHQSGQRFDQFAAGQLDELLNVRCAQ